MSPQSRCLYVKNSHEGYVRLGRYPVQLEPRAASYSTRRLRRWIIGVLVRMCDETRITNEHHGQCRLLPHR